MKPVQTDAVRLMDWRARLQRSFNGIEPSLIPPVLSYKMSCVKEALSSERIWQWELLCNTSVPGLIPRSVTVAVHERWVAAEALWEAGRRQDRKEKKGLMYRRLSGVGVRSQL